MKKTMKTPITINDQETLELLKALIRAKSPDPPGDITACTEIITDLLSQEGIAFEILESKPHIKNIVAVMEGSLKSAPEGQTLLFNGHLDTVPGGAGWDRDPYDPVYQDGYVYGRGSTDMKSGIVAGLMAVIAIKRSGSPFKGKLIYSAVGDEENHSRYGTKYLLQHGLKADHAVCCEPTDLDLVLGNRGLAMVDVLIKGRSCHAGRSHLGVNAVHIAAKIIDAIDVFDFRRIYNDAFEVPTGSCSVVGVQGGAKLNVVPNRCLLHIDRRLMPDEEGPEAVRELAALIENVTGVKPDIEKDDGSDIVMLPEYWHEPYWLSDTHHLAASAFNCIKKVLGRAPAILGKSAGTDASHLFSMGKIPTIIFGPGDYRLSHTPQEKVKFEDILIATKIYRDLALTLLNK
jgi:acetylornithine deacetylase/succinyl-diaminopimelate desuccinylase